LFYSWQEVISVTRNKGRQVIRVSPEQEAIIKIYAERVGEKIRRLVSEIIVDSLTLLWAGRPSDRP